MSTTLIRDIPDHELAAIDTLAQEKKTSREDYLRQVIHAIANNEWRLKQDDHFSQTMDKVMTTIEKTDATYMKILEALEHE